MSSTALWSFLAAIAGACGPLQAALTAQAGVALGSRYYGALVSYVGGALAVLVVAVLSGSPDWSGVARVPLAAWFPGVVGCVYLIFLITATPILGPGLVFGMAVAGQLAFSLLLEQFGWLGTPLIALNPWRLIGLGLILLGVYLIKAS